ncbi:hypothetical protein [Streptomyces acidiscabies]|uniref:Bacterial regulatory proteins, luxR family n=1 Tax=Streptomyces acidiscabies TaxID=42234 RepID=A0ABU4LY18_9ACTN|nr:hypothetical protein [Streptomyces acidiscabies]MDX3020115.1 hypothetical protein [Streptomyces acidiscabies]
MSSAQPTEMRPLTWREGLTRDLVDATEKTRAAWLSRRNGIDTCLGAVMPHLETKFQRGRLGHLRDRGMFQSSLTHPLIGREKQVIVRVAHGMSNAKIGADLFLSEDDQDPPAAHLQEDRHARPGLRCRPSTDPGRHHGDEYPAAALAGMVRQLPVSQRHCERLAP